MVGVGEVFRLATGRDKALMVLGTVAACLHGAALPLMIIVFGDMTDLFVFQGIFTQFLDDYWDCCIEAYNYTKEDYIQDPTLIVPVLDDYNMSWVYQEWGDKVQDDFLGQMNTYAIYYTILGCIVIVLGYTQTVCWQTSSVSQAQRIRTQLFAAILRQEIGWFDTHEAGELNTRLSDDVNKIEKGLGEKLGLFFQYVAAFFAGFIVAFVYGWLLALIVVLVSPLLGISGGVMAQLGASFTSKELKAYARAGAVAEEVLSAIRTVVAFGGEHKEAERYGSNLLEAKNFGIKRGMVNGAGMGIVFFVMFGCYALAFWVGSTLVRNREEYTAGTLLIVFFAVVIGAFSIGNAAPNIQNFAEARGAAYAIFQIIDNKPSIDSSSEAGRKLTHVEGNIEFRDVNFVYPARPEVTVLDGLNLKVSVGQTVALVGASGCGKSTTIQLLQRFYDPEQGQVLLDGVDIREYHVKDLRRHIGVVSQEPVLFGTTIAENIRYGRDGVTQEEIEQAAREANAHSFIMKLPKKYETLVGERGAQLSGGQKQRIAIARALVRNPRVLLLDEATSALDTESEAVVQAALDKAREGRTTIVVAHRLSTIKTADRIAGFMDGRVAEEGTHDELLRREGIYYVLYTNQTKGAIEGEFDELAADLPESPGVKGKAGLSWQLSHDSPAKAGRSLSITSYKAADKAGKGRERTLSTADEEDDGSDLPEVSVRRLMAYNRPEWWLIVLGCLAAILNGIIQPAFAIVFAEILGVFSETDMDEMEKLANFWSGMFAVIGVVAAIAMFGQSYFFARSGECLTMRLRDATFRALLRQEIAFFDDHKNSVGALTTRLATDASAVQGATGSRLGTVLMSVTAIGAGIIIGLVYSAKLTGLIIAFAPFMLIAGMIEMKVMSGKNASETDALEKAGKVATEAIENMRTVATLTKEDKFYDDYFQCSMEPFKAARKKAHLAGLAYGFSQGVLFFAYAACFSFGAYLVQEDGLRYDDMFKVFGAIVFGAMSVGQASAFAPDYNKAKLSSARIFSLLDREPEIDSYSESGTKPADCRGEVLLTGVHFCYPTRPDVAVLRGLNLKVQPGQVVALVGSSGCGKSTVVQLLERFYEPAQGVVAFDSHDSHTLNLQWLRAQMGIVSQEPVLFDASIKDNIAYGDNSRLVDMDEIIEAARMANIHDFIRELPQGYETNVGDKGTQLSGGQKQRVAIARALVRNPKVLLLDEATSALDTESEKVVQEALDRAQKGRTSIVIAHRLSTIQNADLIVCINNGQVAEAGSHAELMAQKGLYYRLNKVQQRQQ